MRKGKDTPACWGLTPPRPTIIPLPRSPGAARAAGRSYRPIHQRFIREGYGADFAGPAPRVGASFLVPGRVYLFFLEEVDYCPHRWG
jgi:hypothetical protein